MNNAGFLHTVHAQVEYLDTNTVRHNTACQTFRTGNNLDT